MEVNEALYLTYIYCSGNDKIQSEEDVFNSFKKFQNMMRIEEDQKILDKKAFQKRYIEEVKNSNWEVKTFRN